MDPATILTRADYEKPRTLDEFETWWHSIHAGYGASREGVVYAREGRGLAKRFFDEAHPMLAYVRQNPPAADIRCQIFARDEEADCVYLDSSDVVIRKFQVTMAVDGRTEKLRLRQLTRDGHVDALAKLNESDEIPGFEPDDDDELNASGAVDQYSRIKEMAARISSALERKIAKGYGPHFTLIVGFDDSTFDPSSLPTFRQHVICPDHTFSEIYIAGILGRLGWMQFRRN